MDVSTRVGAVAGLSVGAGVGVSVAAGAGVDMLLRTNVGLAVGAVFDMRPPTGVNSVVTDGTGLSSQAPRAPYTTIAADKKAS